MYNPINLHSVDFPVTQYLAENHLHPPLVVGGVGETVRIRIETQFDSDLPGAALSVILMDRRMLEIAGKYFFLNADTERKGKSVETIEFEARLWSGTYFITLRLESRMGRNFMPVDKQSAALSFEVTPYEPEFLGMVDIGMKRVLGSPTSAPALITGKKRVVALLAIRNEALYLPRCLEHLYQQGVETCVIDNDSTDESLEIAKQYMGKGVFRIERQPYKGHFDLVEQLRIKEQLAEEIEADWFIHHDADEIREAPPQFSTLSTALLAVDEAGYNAVNFDEFVFLPTDDELEDEEPRDYVRRYRDYYFFSPKPLHRVNAWKKQSSPVDLVTMGGHQVLFPERKLYPEAFILRHYIALSRNHLLKKYGLERVYSPKELEERQWHHARVRFDPTRVRLPRREELWNLDTDGWNRTNPFRTHFF